MMLSDIRVVHADSGRLNVIITPLLVAHDVDFTGFKKSNRNSPSHRNVARTHRGGHLPVIMLTGQDDPSVEGRIVVTFLKDNVSGHFAPGLIGHFMAVLPDAIAVCEEFSNHQDPLAV